jgi:hypothetical protein
VTIGNQSSLIFHSNTSYAPPVLTEFRYLDSNGKGADVGVPVLDSRGMERVEIIGTQFGSLAAQSIDNATFGETGSDVIFLASKCNVTESHTKVQCYTGECTGADLQWLVTIDGQVSVSPRTSVHAPVINRIYGQGVVNGSSLGGDEIFIEGDYFGSMDRNGRTVRTSLGVTYGPTVTEYRAKNCTVIRDQVLIRCLLAPLAAVGEQLRWQVEISVSCLMSIAKKTNSSLIHQTNRVNFRAHPSRLQRMRIQRFHLSTQR